MKILFFLDFFDPGMGYISNHLPEKFSTSNQVFLITPWSSNLSSNLSGSFLTCKEHTTKDVECFEITPSYIHAFLLSTKKTPIGLYFRNLKRTVKIIRPDVIQSIITFPTLSNIQMAYCLTPESKFFLQDHSSNSSSNWSLKGRMFLRIFRAFFTPLISRRTSAVFYPSPDIRDALIDNYGLASNLLSYQPLGTDDRVFHFPSNEEHMIAEQKKASIGLGGKRIVLYTGKLNQAKGLQMLVDAARMVTAEQEDIVFLFVGQAEPEVANFLKEIPCIKHLPAVPSSELNSFYWLADIGVWPKQGSTSIIDAIASGLPVIIRKNISEVERRVYPELLFEDNSLSDLTQKILLALNCPVTRERRLFESKKILENNNWTLLAKRRLEGYAGFTGKVKRKCI